MSRVLDVVVGVIGLMWLAPLLACVALLVGVAGGRPVLDRRPWVGPDGRQATLLRFRTAPPAGTGTLAGAAAQRRLGRLLWVSRIADLPLLINLVRGDFSLFGAPALALQVIEGRESPISETGLPGDLAAPPLGSGKPGGTADTRAA